MTDELELDVERLIDRYGVTQVVQAIWRLAYDRGQNSKVWARAAHYLDNALGQIRCIDWR